MKVAIATLGCKVNQSESASIEGALRNNNYEIVKHTDNPDVCIINTCTVTAKSDYQSRQMIRKFARSGAKVIATGCYAQLKPDELSKIEGLALIVGNSEKERLISYLEDIPDNDIRSDESAKCRISVRPPASHLSAQPYHSSRSRAFLKIQDGCNFSCSYCTVPLARGKSRSLNPQDILLSVKKLSSDGYKEVVLTGIHIGSYGLGLQPKSSLLDVVKEITKTYPEIRIRLSSIEPQEFDEEFLSLIKERNVCPHLHIPLQSGSDNILKAMNRGYSTSYYKQLINRIVTACPDISIGTDVITGFPGETDKDFNDTVKFIDQLPLSYLHVFPYSKRPDTKASSFGNQINDKLKKERVKILIEIGESKKIAYMQRSLGCILDVIVEKKSAIDRYYKAISDNYLRLLVKSDNLTSVTSGESLKVRVISLTDRVLRAEPLK